MKTRIHLYDHFTYSRLLRFTLPSIVMNIFSSLYIIVDGIWHSVVFAELMAAVAGTIFMAALRRKYQY